MLFQARIVRGQQVKTFPKKHFPKKIWVLEALKTADWRSNIGDQKF